MRTPSCSELARRRNEQWNAASVVASQNLIMSTDIYNMRQYQRNNRPAGVILIVSIKSRILFRIQTS
jgi:hypothetical protein